MDFEIIWQLLSPQGEFKRRRGVCERLWQSIGSDAQSKVFETIQNKKAHGEFVNQNPYFAIEDNLPTRGEPTNYNGQRTMPKDTPLVTAKYNGLYGIYTAAEAQLFGMTDIKNYHP